MKTQNNFFLLAPSCICLLLMLSSLVGCGPQVIKSTPPRPEASIPRPPSGKIPATQRPYNINGRTYYPLPSAEGYSEEGVASWYGTPFHGRKTSNGETYNMYDWTVAHKTLPMHTRLLVENLENGLQTTVRVNDRGPFAKDRIIDLSYNVARELGVVKAGTARVRITALGEATTVQLAGNRTEPRFLPHEDFQKGDFYVQIGSFGNKENADRLKEKMISLGKETVTITYDRGDQIFHRVQVRAGSTLTAANSMGQALSEAGFADSFVVAR